MSKRRTAAVAFSGTPEQEKRLCELIEEYKSTPGALMPVLQQTQEIYGYLPEKAMKIIAEKMNIPLEEIYGVATFYTQFTFNPKGKYKISVCLGTACYVKGSAEVLERIKKNLGIEEGECTADGKFSIDATRCLGCCGLAPVMTVNDDVYGKVDPADVDKIIEKYRNM